MHRFVQALLGSTCLTALSAGWVHAGIVIVPDLPDSVAAASGSAGAIGFDATGAVSITGSIARTILVPPGGSASAPEASGSVVPPDLADWFRLDLAPGQQLAFTLSVAPLAAVASGAGGTSLPPDIVTTPDASASGSVSLPGGSASASGEASIPPSGSSSADSSLPVPAGSADPIFATFTLDVLDGALNPLSILTGSGGPDTLHGQLTAPLGGAVFFGLYDFLAAGSEEGMSYSFSFAYGDLPDVTGPPPVPVAVTAPALVTVAAGAAFAGGLGFLRRRKKKR